MNKLIKYFIIGCLSLCPSVVFALSCSTTNLRADGIVNFNHCVVSRCDTYKNGVYYVSTPTYTYSNIGVICNNGNDSPKVVKQVESDCPSVGNICNAGEFKSCTVVIQYDCNKTRSGADYFTTTTTKKTTTKKTTTKKKTTTTTTKTTTTQAPSNTKLSSLNIEGKTLLFNPEVYEYTVDIGSDVSSLNITALPQDNSSSVEIKDNNNLVNESVISIIVTGKDGRISTYKININKEVYIMSNNAKLKSLNIVGYDINFNSTTNEYPLIIDKDTKSLNINYETEDSKASVNITGNENLVNNSSVIVNVVAEDGTENNYVINITLKKETNAFKYIFVIILVLALGAGGYYIYKRFIASKMGDKYEYE